MAAVVRVGDRDQRPPAQIQPGERYINLNILATILSRVRAWLGCSHKRSTFPLTPPKGECYIVCLDCGAEFTYNWQTMQATGTRRPSA